MANTKHTLEQALEAADKGITKAGAARVLGVSRQTMVGYCKRWKTLAEAFADKRGELVDLAEMGLRGAVLRGEAWAVAFTLRTLGKDEGYTERQEHTGKDGGPIGVEHGVDDDAARRVADLIAGAIAGRPPASG